MLTCMSPVGLSNIYIDCMCGLRRFHMGASNAHPIRIGCVHMNAHWVDAHPMRIGCKSDRIHLVRWFGCAFKQDFIIIHDSREVMPTTRSLARSALLVCLAYGACLSLLSVLLLQQHWGKRGLFADGQVEWYSTVKLKVRWFRCLQHLNLTYYSRPARCVSGASLRTAFQLVLVSWYPIFQSCVAFCCYV